MNKDNVITCEVDGETKFYKILGTTYCVDKSPETEALRTDLKHRNNPFLKGKGKYQRILIQLN